MEDGPRTVPAGWSQKGARVKLETEKRLKRLARRLGIPIFLVRDDAMRHGLTLMEAQADAETPAALGSDA